MKAILIVAVTLTSLPTFAQQSGGAAGSGKTIKNIEVKQSDNTGVLEHGVGIKAQRILSVHPDEGSATSGGGRTAKSEASAKRGPGNLDRDHRLGIKAHKIKPPVAASGGKTPTSGK